MHIPFIPMYRLLYNFPRALLLSIKLNSVNFWTLLIKFFKLLSLRSAPHLLFLKLEIKDKERRYKL